MEEKVFFDRDGVSVSNARFIVHGQTYAMNGVTSVKQSVESPFRMGPIAIGILGLLLLLVGGGAVLFGVIILGVAIIWWLTQKPQWNILLSSSSGEAQALSSHDEAFIAGVIGALNQAIVHRG